MSALEVQSYLDAKVIIDGEEIPLSCGKFARLSTPRILKEQIERVVRTYIKIACRPGIIIVGGEGKFFSIRQANIEIGAGIDV